MVGLPAPQTPDLVCVCELLIHGIPDPDRMPAFRSQSCVGMPVPTDTRPGVGVGRTMPQSPGSGELSARRP